MLDDNEFRFMAVTRHILKDVAAFDEENPRAFDLKTSPAQGIPVGRYVLKADESTSGVVSYRPNTALGEDVLEAAKKLETPYADVRFDITGYPGKVPLQKELDNIRRDIRRARANVSAVEDETDEKRRRLLDALQRKLIPEISREELFTIRWQVS